jgi:hypothetical protein
MMLITHNRLAVVYHDKLIESAGTRSEGDRR